MKALLGFALALLLGAGPAASPRSQAFPDRAAALDQRIATDAAANKLAPGQQAMLQAQLTAARASAQSPQAGSMLDVIDRELALVDFTLGRAENGMAIVTHVGDTITLAMRDENGYDVQLDGSALVRGKGVMYIRGVQGMYTAEKPGTYRIQLTPLGTTKVAPAAFTVVVLPR